MTGSPASVSVLALAGCLVSSGLLTTLGTVRSHPFRLTCSGVALWILCGFASAWAVEGVQPPPAVSSQAGPLLDFDIPAQPLLAALNRYASLTSRPALVSSEAVAGRTSAAIRGRYPPETALRMLLEGTGLAAERIRSGPADAFVLKPARIVAAPLEAALARAGDYPGLVQARLWDALCADARTRPGNYRALLRFGVDGVGQVRQVQLLGSTGNAQRDAALRTRLEQVRMGDPPPPGMPQPLTMIVMPSDSISAGTAPRCDGGAS